METIIFNLCEGVETRATETKVEAYRRENAADIARRQQRNAEEDRSRGVALAGTSGARGDAGEKDSAAGADPWAPRRMSADVSDLDETPGPADLGGKKKPNTDGSSGGGFGGMFGDTPGSRGASHARQVVPVPASAAPVPMSAGKLMEGGHGRHAHHAGWDDAAKDPAARAKREADIAAACGVDLVRLGRKRAAQEALTSVFC